MKAYDCRFFGFMEDEDGERTILGEEYEGKGGGVATYKGNQRRMKDFISLKE